MTDANLDISDVTNRLSLRLKLTVWIVVIFSVIKATTLGVAWLYERSAVFMGFDAQLLDQARQIAASVNTPEGGLTSAELDAFVRSSMMRWPFINVTSDIVDQAGASVLFPSRPRVGWRDGVPFQSDAGPQARFRHVLVAGVPVQNAAGLTWRAVAVPLPGRIGAGRLLVVAASDEVPRWRLATMLQVGILSSLVGLAAAGISGWFIGGLAVRPLERLRTMVQRISPQSLNQPLRVPNATVEFAQLSRDLDDARKRLQQGFLAQERFLSNVSHEIKTPIAVILLESQTLSRRGFPPHLNVFVKSVEDELTKLGRLVESFLTLTRIQDGKGLAKLGLVTGNDLVMESLQNCAMMANQHKVELRPTLLADDDVIDAAVRGDPYLLGTMLDNLVRNAIRFSPEHGRIEMNLSANHGRLTISVRDQGPGIPPERLSTIFDRFAQVPADNHAGRGHGLGLAIAQGIAELHGGCIFASNVEEGGSEFTISLPLHGAVSPAAAV